eukprot:scaffold121752_cov29-Tisochrysis_lutea.AAC.12
MHHCNSANRFGSLVLEGLLRPPDELPTGFGDPKRAAQLGGAQLDVLVSALLLQAALGLVAFIGCGTRAPASSAGAGWAAERGEARKVI